MTDKVLHLLLLLGSMPIAYQTNSVDSSEHAGSSKCVKGKEYYNFDRKVCKRCPRCKKSPDFQDYNITEDEKFGAIECYPCYCKFGKVFNSNTKRCEGCPQSCHDGVELTIENITMDRWNGAQDCPCRCNKGYYKNDLTQYQCVGCMDCSTENKVFSVHCSPIRNSQCGSCSLGFTVIDIGIRKECVKNESSQIDKMVRPVDTSVTTEATKTDNSKGLYEFSGHRSWIILVVILVLVTFIAFVMVYLCYRWINNKPCHMFWNSSLPASAVTTTSSVYKEADGIESATSVRTSLLQNTNIEMDNGGDNQPDNNGQTSDINHVISAGGTNLTLSVGSVHVLQVGDGCKCSFINKS